MHACIYSEQQTYYKLIFDETLNVNKILKLFLLKSGYFFREFDVIDIGNDWNIILRNYFDLILIWIDSNSRLSNDEFHKFRNWILLQQ